MDLLSDHPALFAVAIFLARILDVSIGTLRTILIIRGYRLEGSLLGFLEILIWVTAVGQVITNLESWYLVVGYAAGFACGNYVGSWLEAKLALGTEIVRAISRNPESNLREQLDREGFGLVQLAGSAADGSPVDVLFVVESRRRVPRLLRAIEEADPGAVCSISDVKHPAARSARAVPRTPLRGGWRTRAKRK